MNHGIDHADIAVRFERLCPRARVLPAIEMAAAAGDIRFYARTDHLAQDSSNRFAVACILRGAMRAALDTVIMGGDVWWKPRLTGDGA